MLDSAPHGNQSFFRHRAKGVTDLLATELTSLGATSVSDNRAGVDFEGTLETAYRACLWSRLANRILMPLGNLPLRIRMHYIKDAGPLTGLRTWTLMDHWR